jgi:integrase
VAAKLRQKDGAYWVVVHHDGRRRWKKIGTDRREAQKVVSKINAQLALGEFSMKPKASALNVEASLQQWYDDYKPTFSDSYAQLAEIIIRLHLVPFFGSMRLDEVEERHILQFVSEKTTRPKNPLKAATLKNILSLFRRVMTLAVEREDISRNPCRNLGGLLTKVSRQQIDEVKHADSWTRDEVRTLLATAREEDPRFYPFVSFLVSTGCRRGEALGLKWADVNFENGRIHIRRALVRGRLGTPKSGRSRFVVISPGLSEVLKALLSKRRQTALSGRWKTTPDFVFCSETGGPLDERNVTRSWARLRRKAQKAGVRPLRLHDARHTFASLALASGKSISWVSNQLGHASPETTLRVYAHALSEEETDLSFLDFDTPDDTKRHPRGTRAVAVGGNRKPPRLTRRTGLGNLERETGFEPATLSLGM